MFAFASRIDRACPFPFAWDFCFNLRAKLSRPSSVLGEETTTLQAERGGRLAQHASVVFF